MAKKQPKKIAKITHIKLTKKDGGKFDFSQPLGEEIQTSTLAAPKIDSGVGGTYINLPEFLEFKNTLKQKTENPQLLLEQGEVN